MPVVLITSPNEFAQLEKNATLSVVHFMADWAPQCNSMNDVLAELQSQDDLKNVSFAKIMAEDIPEVSQRFDIKAVPTFLLIQAGKVVDRIDGANASELTNKVKSQASKISLLVSDPAEPKENLNIRLKRLINFNKCMLFMKGSPDAPKCGFSKTTVELLNKYNAAYSSFDILSDEEVRQGLKTYSNWPTYPQLYIAGELIGGLDILKEMDSSGDLQAALPKKVDLHERLKGLINKSDIMVFMKGDPSQPKCGFSKQLIEILNATGVSYDSFDILTDEDVRLGLKTYSNWPTYPQVYAKGELIGGLDIIKEMQSDNSLISALKVQ